MKYCTNCGTKIKDNSLFCEECGAKQENTVSDNDNHAYEQTIVQTFDKPKAKKKGIFKFLAIVIVLALVVYSAVFVFKSCSTPTKLEDVASEFTEALLIDFNTTRTVSLMSEELVEYYMEQMNVSNRTELALCFSESFRIRQEDTIGYYGDDWRAKVIDVSIEEVNDDEAFVIVTVSHEGSDALWHTNIEELYVYLVNENDAWRVIDFES